MQSRFSSDDAARFTRDLAGSNGGKNPAGHAVSEDLALRTYTARLLGGDSALVLHGGGNTSVKSKATTLLGESIDVLHIKGSGWDLATIEPAGHPAVRLEPLSRLRTLAAMSDEEMVNELRLNLLDASAPTPSVETLLHAFLPAKFIDHTHADAVLAVADQPDAESICREIYGAGLVWVPYVMPGFALALRCATAYDRVAEKTTPTVIVLEKHGIFTFGATAKESYERMIAAVTQAEEYVRSNRQPVTVAPVARVNPTYVLPRIRGALAKAMKLPPEQGPIVRLRTNDEVLRFLSRHDAQELSQIGCATPDHVLRTKPTALFIQSVDEAGGTFPELFERELEAFANRYNTYFDEMTKAKNVTRTRLDPWPRVILIPGLGICTLGNTRREADIVADVYEHTIGIMASAADIGQYTPVSRSDLFDVEYWSLEQAKLKKAAEPPLAKRIAVVTGAASGIGRATAIELVRRGAHVVASDRDEKGLEKLIAELKGFSSQITRVRGDMTIYEDAEWAIHEAVLTYGGVDIVVSNAGTAPEGRLDTAEGAQALEESLAINLVSHNHVARAACNVMLAQGSGGAILFNASKAAFNPGPNFGPYAVAKTALVALMRQYAIDLGSSGIRSNAINADRIRTRLFEGGVVESRAKARGLSVDEYFRANLLQREVTAEDVANGFVYLASATATTGAIVTIDGGNAAAFPR